MEQNRPEPMKISFDFDNTLDNPKMQRMAKKFMNMGAKVFITTSRSQQQGTVRLPNHDLFRTAKMLDIPKKRIRFTNGEPKVLFLEGFDLHFDDMYGEIQDINRYSRTCQGVLFTPHNIRKRL